MKRFAAAWLATALPFLALDAAWLSTMAQRLYRPALGPEAPCGRRQMRFQAAARSSRGCALSSVREFNLAPRGVCGACHGGLPSVVTVGAHWQEGSE